MADASVIVELLLGSGKGKELARLFREADAEIHVPAMCDTEVASALRRAVLRGSLDLERALDALQDYLELPFVRHGHTLLLQRTLELRDNFSVYDATYLALAEGLEASFLTVDRRLTRAVERHLKVQTL